MELNTNRDLALAALKWFPLVLVVGYVVGLVLG